MADRREMDADLVRPAGVQVDLEQRPAGETFANAIARNGRATGGDDGHAAKSLWVAANGRLDAPDLCRNRAVDERQVRLLDAARLELGHQRRLGAVVPRNEDEAAG